MNDWVPILGALAWLPALYALKPLFAKAKIRIITEKRLTVGFNSWGPLLWVRVAFATSGRDAVISNLSFELKHADGEKRSFHWHRITHHMANLKVPDAGAIPFEKVAGVLAMKLNTRDIEERMIHFQDPALVEKIDMRGQTVRRKYVHCIATGTVSEESFLLTEEASDYLVDVQQSFNWRAGEYRLSFKIDSPETCAVKDTEYRFELSPSDISALEENKAIVSKELVQRLRRMRKIETERYQWKIRTVILRKTSD